MTVYRVTWEEEVEGNRDITIYKEGKREREGVGKALLGLR